MPCAPGCSTARARSTGAGMNKRRQVLRSLSASIATMVAPKARTQTNLASTPLRIGYCLSPTGPLGGNGQSARLAHEIWREDVNRAGGLLGRLVHERGDLQDGDGGHRIRSQGRMARAARASGPVPGHRRQQRGPVQGWIAPGRRHAKGHGLRHLDLSLCACALTWRPCPSASLQRHCSQRDTP